jgi:hypothetical protein
MKFNTNVAIFFLFFGVSLIEALQAGNWLKAVFWFAIGLVFLIADNLKSRSQT